MIYFFIFLTEMYPVINNLFNLTYESLVFRSLSFISLFYILFIFFREIILDKKMSKKMLWILLVSSIFSVSILISISIHGNLDDFARVKFSMLFIRSLPMILAAYVLVKKPYEWHLKRIKVINFIITLSLLKFLYFNKSSMFLAHTLNFGGVNYNDFGYISALNIAFSFILLFSIYTDELSKNKKSIAYYILSLIISFSALFFSGGRGALMLGLVFVIIFLVNILKKQSIDFIKIIKILSSILLLVISVILIVYSTPALRDGLVRGFSFLSVNNGGIIDWENTSGRLDIYKDSLNLISYSPFIGYGIGSVYLLHPSAHFSHNIFLDLMVDGGVVFTGFCGVFLLYMIINSIKKSTDLNIYFSFCLFLFSFINLLSGSNYLIEPIFWFSISYIFLYDSKLATFKLKLKSRYNEN